MNVIHKRGGAYFDFWKRDFLSSSSQRAVAPIHVTIQFIHTVPLSPPYSSSLLVYQRELSYTFHCV